MTLNLIECYSFSSKDIIAKRGGSQAKEVVNEILVL